MIEGYNLSVLPHALFETRTSVPPGASVHIWERDEEQYYTQGASLMDCVKSGFVLIGHGIAVEPSVKDEDKGMLLVAWKDHRPREKKPDENPYPPLRRIGEHE